jgi:pimeloyl-ACP methyl ester carboxylesterase
LFDLDARIEAFPTRHLANGGDNIAYREAGKGVPVVLLHGISSGSASWLLQLEAWSKHFRVIAWDAPGYGDSTALLPSEPRVCDYVATLERLIGACCAEPVHLVGHSLGALIAAAFARRFPQKLRTLTLVNPALGYGAEGEDVRREKLSRRLEQLGQLGPEGLAVQRAPLLVSKHASELAIELLRWNVRRLSVQGYAQAARMLALGNLIEDVASLQMPLMIIAGGADDITPAGSAAAVAQACPAARLVLLPAVGHASYLEDVAGVSAAFFSFALADERVSGGAVA